MKPKTRRNVCRKLRLSRISSEPRSALSWAGLDPHPGRHLGRDPPFQPRRRDPVGGGDRDLVEAPALVGQCLRDRQRHLGDAGAAEGGAAEPGEADQAELPETALADQPDPFAELEAGAVGGGLVDRGFGRAAGPVAVEVGERLEPARQGRGDELGGEFVADLLALGVEEATGREDRPRRQLHPGSPLDPRQQRGADRRHFAVVLLDRVLGADDDAGPAQRLFEDFVEGGEDRVGEDEAAGDEGDADDHREGGPERPDLAGPEALEGEASQAASSARSRRPPSQGRRRGRACRRAA